MSVLFRGMGDVIGSCASRDICLDALGFAVGLRCPFLGGLIWRPICCGLGRA